VLRTGEWYAARFLPLRDLAALDAALARAAAGPILLFKHSPTCGISAQAHAELGDWLDRTPEGVPPVYLISVREHRAVSNAVSERFGIRHESPQVLLIDATGVRWHASHFRVSPDEVQAAIGKLAVSAR
jgi:bacillithiol system protein YtxJ